MQRFSIFIVFTCLEITIPNKIILVPVQAPNVLSANRDYDQNLLNVVPSYSQSETPGMSKGLQQSTGRLLAQYVSRPDLPENEIIYVPYPKPMTKQSEVVFVPPSQVPEMGMPQIRPPGRQGLRFPLAPGGSGAGGGGGGGYRTLPSPCSNESPSPPHVTYIQLPNLPPPPPAVIYKPIPSPPVYVPVLMSPAVPSMTSETQAVSSGESQNPSIAEHVDSQILSNHEIVKVDEEKFSGREQKRVKDW